MLSRKVINTLLENNKNITIATLGRRLGITSQNVNNTLKGYNSKSMGVDRLVKMLEAFDYKLVAVPASSNVKGYVIDEKE